MCLSENTQEGSTQEGEEMTRFKKGCGGKGGSKGGRGGKGK